MSPIATSGRTNGTVAADTSDKPFVSSPLPHLTTRLATK